GINCLRSSLLRYTTRSAPAVNAVFPPRSCFGAHSRTRTRAPVSAAERAAHSAALPAPTIRTSLVFEVLVAMLQTCMQKHTTKDSACPAGVGRCILLYTWP